jgi:hypothetical protein
VTVPGHVEVVEAGAGGPSQLLVVAALGPEGQEDQDGEEGEADQAVLDGGHVATRGEEHRIMEGDGVHPIHGTDQVSKTQ